VARSVLSLIAQEVSDLERIIASFEGEGVLRRFPDGSIYLTTEDAYVRFFAVFEGRGGLINQHGWRSLGAFAPARFVLVYPRSYWDLLVGTVGGFFSCGTNVGQPTPSEFNLQSLAITLRLKRKPGTEIRERYAEMIVDWLASVSEHGVFDEGPIGRASQFVEFQGLRAQFRIDASASGQHTLNWFILKALQFGIDVSPVSVILIAAEEALDKACPAVGKVTKVSLEQTGERRQGSKEIAARGDDALSGRLPSDCVPHSEPGCKLRVFKRPREEWEAWRVAVYFTVEPNRQQRKSFRDLIKAWQTLGEFAGFGGRSISGFLGLRFEPKTASASFDADMGGADPEVAVPLLLRVLEGFDSAIVAIEAVVFGDADPGA
jgi:hypothetical protein